ncbi:TD and POZ domain-containing protein 1 [Araneus ventricosus]|uniref:TD and POZ domain-containing protein 1 n=1 Tax=Araneus ventricosus TaxID=182803 RepID=A0A4Y2D5H5_ARAVE|nr:TD and POZ domain-containing protein 1 [Araneus ventricosus]
MSCERKCFSVKWRIEKFRSWLQKQEDILYSPEFTVETMEGTKWRLSISSECEPTLKYIALALLREVEDDGPKLIDLDYELAFLANDESPLKREKFTKIFGNTTSSHELMVKKDTVLVEKMHDYLPQDNLTVSCRIWRNRSSVAKNGRCFIRSVIGLERITLDGMIENFSNLNSFSYRTVNFIKPSTGTSLVSLNFYLDRDNRIEFERISFKRKFLFTSKLFVIDAVGNKRECCNKYSRLKYVPLSALGTHEFILDSTIEELAAKDFLPNDKLTLQYEVAFCPGIELENIEYEFPQNDSDLEDLNVCNSEEHYDASNNTQFADKQLDVEEEQSELMTSFKNDMTSLCKDHLFCDTLLQTGTETFPAHRSVLSARSPVFKKMFTTDMKEKAGELINIPDLSPETVRQMLLFIYTDATDDLDWENAKELYFASDKYEILTLKRRCSLFLKQNLIPFRVTEILILADRHQDDELKSAVQEYILKYNQEVFSSDEWKRFMESYCHLAAQIMYMQCLKK